MELLLLLLPAADSDRSSNATGCGVWKGKNSFKFIRMLEFFKTPCVQSKCIPL
jgi:hypothetical protein